MLTSKYLHGIPADARAAKTGGRSLGQHMLSEDNIARIAAPNGIAERRGQSLAQMAIAWVLRAPPVPSALIGARTVAPPDESLDAVQRPDYTTDRKAHIHRSPHQRHLHTKRVHLPPRQTHTAR